MFGSVKPTTRKGMNSIRTNDEAVSPVIGVILMVAVTVILAAVIAAFIFGFTGNMPKAPNVAYFNVERVINASGGEDIKISTTSPNVVEITKLSIDIDAADAVGSTAGSALTTAQIAELQSTGSVTVPDNDPEDNENKVVITGSVSGLAVQVLQAITV